MTRSSRARTTRHTATAGTTPRGRAAARSSRSEPAPTGRESPAIEPRSGAAADNDTIELSPVSSSSTAYGGSGDDAISAFTTGGNTIDAGLGNDTIQLGQAGLNTAFGGPGDDVFNLGFASGQNALDGGRGFDSITLGGGQFPSVGNTCWRIESIDITA